MKFIIVKTSQLELAIAFLKALGIVPWKVGLLAVKALIGTSLIALLLDLNVLHEVSDLFKESLHQIPSIQHYG